MIRKFADYFRLATVRHYLLADTASRIVIHHQRDGEKIASRILYGGELRLDPPGIRVEVGEFFADLPPEESETP